MAEPQPHDFGETKERGGEAARALFAAILEHSPAAVAMFDNDMRYIHASKRWCDNFNLTVRDVIGRNHYELFPELPEKWIAVHERALAGHVETCDLDTFDRADGSVQYVRWSIMPWRTSKGKIGGIILLSEELTEKQRLALEIAEEQLRFNAALSIADAAVWEWDPKKNRFYASEKLAELTGLPVVDSSWVRSYYTYLHPDDLAAFEIAVKAFWEGGEIFAQDHRIRQPDGSYRWVRSNLTRIDDGKGAQAAVIGFIKDIGSLKEAELAARDAEEKAIAASAAKSQFLATMSHEIRTPMNGILGMASALEATPLSADQRDMLNVIQSSGQDLLALLNDLLEVAKADAGKIELHETDFFVPEFLDKVAALYRETAEAKGNRLEHDIGASARVSLKGDEVRIRQILNNLISNAIKFTDGGRIAISAERKSIDGKMQVVFAVRDTGIGIPGREFERIFEPFVQVDPSLSRRYSGTGLGLTICKRLAERMHGSIGVESEPGKGSCFSLYLPLAETARATPSTARTQSGVALSDTLSGLRILVAEDNRKNQTVLKAMLGAVGAQMIFAENGEEAVGKWCESEIDLVLMDIRMPGTDGLWAARQIRELEDATGRARTPIVALTADATSESVAGALAAGMDAHVAKPFTLKPLLATICELAPRR